MFRNTIDMIVKLLREDVVVLLKKLVEKFVAACQEDYCQFGDGDDEFGYNGQDYSFYNDYYSDPTYSGCIDNIYHRNDDNI